MAEESDALSFLDPSLSPWVLITEVYWIADRLYERRLSELQITAPQARLLNVLHHAARPLRPTEIAEVLFREVASISPLMQRMQERGWIVRMKHPEIANAVAVDLTAIGKRLAARADAISLALFKDLFEPVLTRKSAQLDALRAVRDRAFELPEVDFRLRRARRWPVWRL